jgi:hypothetical protein
VVTQPALGDVQVWDYIFLEKPYNPACGIAEAVLASLKRVRIDDF